MDIKICGLKRIEDVDYVNQYEPEWIGFIFAGRKRKIDFETARLLKNRLKPSIKAVGVFVNEEIDFIVKLAAYHVIDLIQLHGDEDEEYIHRLYANLAKRRESDYDIPVIKAVRVKSTRQVLEAEKLPVDYLLLDAFMEDEYGGGGKVFDHRLIPCLSKPYLLAGGIDCNNVIKILDSLQERNITLPCCIDVSSSVETDGCKDAEKIEKIISVVHAWNK
ncbi:MAG: phosphoribosylanthranilate isomerase [Clostridium sp.]|nr:phosphoribosylanthranilate isomerase [Clostridium sp.]